MSDTLATALIGPRGPRGAQIIPGSGAPTDAPSQQAGDLWLDVSESHTLTLYGPKDKVTGWPSTPLLTVNGSAGLTTNDVNALIATAIANLPPSGLTTGQVQALITTATAGLQTSAQVQTAIAAAIASLPAEGVTTITLVQTAIATALAPYENTASVSDAIAAALAPYETTAQVTAAIVAALAPYGVPESIDHKVLVNTPGKIRPNPRLPLLSWRDNDLVGTGTWLDESYGATFGHIAYWVAGWDGNGGGNVTGYSPYILPYDLNTDEWLDPIRIPAPAGIPQRPAPSCEVQQPANIAARTPPLPNDVQHLGLFTVYWTTHVSAGDTPPPAPHLPGLRGWWIDGSNTATVDAGGVLTGPAFPFYDQTRYLLLVELPDDSPVRYSDLVNTPPLAQAPVDYPDFEADLRWAWGSYGSAAQDPGSPGWGFEGGSVAALDDHRIIFGGGDSNFADPAPYLPDGMPGDVVWEQDSGTPTTYRLDYPAGPISRFTFTIDVPAGAILSVRHYASDADRQAHTNETQYWGNWPGPQRMKFDGWGLTPGTYISVQLVNVASAGSLPAPNVGMGITDTTWSNAEGRAYMIYDTVADTFTTTALCPIGVDYSNAWAVGDGKFYTLSLRTQGPNVYAFVCYDPATDTWETLPDPSDQINALADTTAFHNVANDPNPGLQVGRELVWPNLLGCAYNLDTGVFSVAYSDPLNPDWEDAIGWTIAPDGKWWIVAPGQGFNSAAGGSTDIRIYDPETATWSDGPYSFTNDFSTYSYVTFTPAGLLRTIGGSLWVGGDNPQYVRDLEVASSGLLPVLGPDGAVHFFLGAQPEYSWDPNSLRVFHYDVNADGTPNLSSGAPVSVFNSDTVQNYVSNGPWPQGQTAEVGHLLTLLFNAVNWPYAPTLRGGDVWAGSGQLNLGVDSWGSQDVASIFTKWAHEAFALGSFASGLAPADLGNGHQGYTWKYQEGSTSTIPFQVLWDKTDSILYVMFNGGGTAAYMTAKALRWKNADPTKLYWFDGSVEHDLTAGGGGSGNANVIETVNTVVANGPITLPDPTVATMHDVTVQAACAITLPAPVAGASFQVAVTQDLAGGHAVTFVGPVIWPGTGTAVAPDTTAQRMSLYSFESFDGVNYEVVPPESSRPQRGIYELTGTIAAGQNELTWTTTPLADEQMLNYTDPKRPTALVAGIYAVSVMGWTDTTTANPWTIHLNLDVDNIGAENWGTARPGSGRSKAGAALTYYVPQGGGFSFSIEHTEAAPLAFTGQAEITLIQPVTLPVI